MSEIYIRPFNKEKDAGFIFSTLPKGVYYGSKTPITIDKQVFFDEIYEYVKEQVDSSQILIAALKDDEFTILGYMILSKTHVLEWIYVKELFRKQDIASLLIKNQDIRDVNLANLTRIGASILKRHKSLLKQAGPVTLEKKDDLNEERT